MDLEDAAYFFASLCAIGALLVALAAIVAGVDRWINPPRMVLARQIAEGTHEVRWDTNEFGTLEVQIVEIANDN